MPQFDLPSPLLVEMFSPPPVYVDLASTLRHEDPDGKDWHRQVVEHLDDLKIDLEFDKSTIDEYPDASASAQINPRHRDNIAKILAEPMDAFATTLDRVREELRDGLMCDMRRLLTPLMQPSNASLREALEEVPERWMECVVACNGLKAFLDMSIREWPAESLDWFLDCAGPPDTNTMTEVVQALSLHPQKSVPRSPAHIQACVQWCAKASAWKTNLEVGGVHLVQALKHPDGSLLKAMEEAGSYLDWDNVGWALAMHHDAGLPKGHSLNEDTIGKFLEKYAKQLVELFPDHWHREGEPELPMGNTGASLTRLSRPASLYTLLGVVKLETRRQKIQAEMENAALSMATSPSHAKRSAHRL